MKKQSMRHDSLLRRLPCAGALLAVVAGLFVSTPEAFSQG